METIGLLLLVMFATWVCWKLGIFKSVVHLTDVATRESAAYGREHKARVAKRYESLAAEIDIEKVTKNVATIDALNFD